MNSGFNTRFRILHCLRAPVGGLFRHVTDLAVQQAAHGHSVGVLCDALAGDALTAARLEALEPHLRLGLIRTAMPRHLSHRDLVAYFATRKTALRLDVDVLHGHGAKGGAYARLVALSLNRQGHAVRSFYTPHGGSLHYDRSSLVGRLYLAAERRLAQLSDGIIFESAYAQRMFAGKVGGGLAPERVIANGLKPAEFYNRELKVDAADFVFVGELRKLKGVDVLLRALAKVNANRPARAVIVGAGPDAKDLADLSAQLKLDKVVSFVGALPARDAFERGRCLIVPSRAESLPYVVLEAGAAGVPLIASDVGGIPEIINGTDMQLMPAGDDVALAEAMHCFLDNERAAQLQCENLRKQLAQRFSIATMSKAVTEFYAQAASANAPA